LLSSCGKNLNQSPKYGLNAEAVYRRSGELNYFVVRKIIGIGLQGNFGLFDNRKVRVDVVEDALYIVGWHQ